jgi:cytidine deaminase
MKKPSLQLKHETRNKSDLKPGELELVETAKAFAQKAYAPYSNFKVGAAVLLHNKKIIGGNNQENAAYPSGLCAERVCLFNASSYYPGATVVEMAIYADTPNTEQLISPCGACRQVMMEFEFKQQSNMRIWLSNKHDELILIESCAILLPMAFIPSHLK